VLAFVGVVVLAAGPGLSANALPLLLVVGAAFAFAVSNVLTKRYGPFDPERTSTLFPDFACAGGLLAYGPNLLDMYRQSGVMMGKVLKGTKPVDLPIERPTNFQLVLNLKTAKALGIPIPTSVLLRADEVIE
jgi:hypothetical protein